MKFPEIFFPNRPQNLIKYDKQGIFGPGIKNKRVMQWQTDL